MQKHRIKLVTRVAIVLALPVMVLLTQPTDSTSQPGAGLDASARSQQKTHHAPPMNVSFMSALQTGFR